MIESSRCKINALLGKNLGDLLVAMIFIPFLTRHQSSPCMSRDVLNDGFEEGQRALFVCRLSKCLGLLCSLGLSPLAWGCKLLFLFFAFLGIAPAVQSQTPAVNGRLTTRSWCSFDLNLGFCCFGWVLSCWDLIVRSLRLILKLFQFGCEDAVVLHEGFYIGGALNLWKAINEITGDCIRMNWVHISVGTVAYWVKTSTSLTFSLHCCSRRFIWSMWC